MNMMEACTYVVSLDGNVAYVDRNSMGRCR